MRIILLFLFCLSLMLIPPQEASSTEIVRFSAIDYSTKNPVIPDSIVITDLTLNLSKTITIDSADLDLIFTDVVDNNQATPQRLFIAPNNPNPFDGATDFKIYKSTSSDLNIRLFDLMGNSIFSQTLYLESGIHSFSLNASGLQSGVYFLAASDDLDRQMIKLMKNGSGSGNSCIINYLGNEYLPQTMTGGDKNNVILINNDFWSFQCFAKGYQSLRTAIQFEDVVFPYKILFTLETRKTYNIVSGYFQIYGINFNHRLHIVENYTSGGGRNDSTDNVKNDNFTNIIQNRFLPHPDSYYYGPNGSFLSCPGVLNENNKFSFCDKYFSITYFGPPPPSFYDSSRTVITQIQFNDTINSIDSIKITLYNRLFHAGGQQLSGTSNEVTSTNLILYNLSFSTDSTNNLFVNLIGNSIINHLNVKYDRTRTYSWGYDNFGNETESIISVNSVADDAYIRITLSP